MRRMPVARFIGSGLYSWRVDPSVPSDGNGVPSGYLIGNNAQSVGDHPAHELRREDRSSVHSTNLVGTGGHASKPTEHDQECRTGRARWGEAH